MTRHFPNGSVTLPLVGMTMVLGSQVGQMPHRR
jgi:hypothetical protein